MNHAPRPAVGAAAPPESPLAAPAPSFLNLAQPHAVPWQPDYRQPWMPAQWGHWRSYLPPPGMASLPGHTGPGSFPLNGHL